MHVVRGSIAVFLLVYECTFCDWPAEVSSSVIGRFCPLEDYKKPSISVLRSQLRSDSGSEVISTVQQCSIESFSGLQVLS